MHLPPRLKQTPRVDLASCLSPRQAHLVRATSIISSSDPHKLTVQGEGEAAPAGVHRVHAVCWPRGLLTPPHPPPQGLQPHKSDCAFIPVGSAPPTFSPRLPLRPRHDAPQATHAGSNRGKGPAERRAASCPAGTQVPALPSLGPGGLPRQGQPST